MSAHVTAVARTPWARRHTRLAGARPEQLLEAALVAALDRAGVAPTAVDRVLVACDESVGAQHHNIARRVVAGLGWGHLPGFTLDGAGTAGLGGIALAADLPGRTLVAAVDMTSLIPPGAGLVRDYGRPAHAEPAGATLDRIARERGLTLTELDAHAMTARDRSLVAAPAIVPVRVAGGVVDADAPDIRPLDPDAPSLLEDGLQTANHVAELADGAVALLVEVGAAEGSGRRIDAAGTDAGVDGFAVASRLAAEAADRDVWTAAGSAVEGVILQADTPSGVAPILAIGSTPSADGLRLVADCFHLAPGACRLIRAGADAQVAWVDLDAG